MAIGSVAEREARAGILFERLARAEPLDNWTAIGLPGEALRAPVAPRDVVLIRRRDATAIERILDTRGDWVLAADARGHRWRRIAPNGRVREGLVVARHRPRALLEGVPPQLTGNVSVTLPTDAELATLKTGLRLDNLAETTRTALARLAAELGAHPGEDAFDRLEAARDAMVHALATKPTLSSKTRPKVQRAIDQVGKLLPHEDRYRRLIAFGALTDIATRSGADAMAQLAEARDELGAFEKVTKLLKDARAASRAIVKLLDASLVVHPTAIDRITGDLLTWTTTAVTPTKQWTALKKYVDNQRAGGRYDTEHLTHATVGREIEAGGAVISEWKLLGVGDLLGAHARQVGARNEDLTAAIKDVFGAAFRGTDVANPSVATVKSCVDALVVRWSALATERAALDVHVKAFIVTVAGDRLQADPSVERRLAAAAAERATKDFVADLRAVADRWPFGPDHFLRRTLAAFDSFGAGFDIFELVGRGLRKYTLLGQDPITVAADITDNLVSAEKHYFAMRPQFPAASFRVDRHTGAFNFRLGRQKVLRKILLRGPKGFFVHTVGRGIDINYPDGRNPHVTQSSDIWIPVKSVLSYAAASSTNADEKAELEKLAAIPFSTYRKTEEQLLGMLDASRLFQQHHAAWEAGAPATFVVPQTSWPSAKAYQQELEKAGGALSTKAVKAAQRARDDARTKEKAARKQLVAGAQRLAWNWVDDLAKLGPLIKAAANTKHGSQLLRLRIAYRGVPTYIRDLFAPAKAWKHQLSKLARSERRPAVADGGDEVERLAEIARKTIVSDAAARGLTLSSTRKQARTRKTWQSETEYYEGLLAWLPDPAAWSALQQTAAGLDAAIAATDTAQSDPVLVKARKGAEELAVIKARAAFKSHHKKWATQGFTDHELLFVWAMIRGGFTWGGEFAEPDLHHFEKKAPLSFAGGW